MNTHTPASGATPDPSADPSADPHAASAIATVPLKRGSKTTTCPICATTFTRRATGGTCPVCGEQVLAPDESTTVVPVITPLLRWLLAEGNWRIVAVVTLVVYQVALAIILWRHLAQIHAF